jgi:hypothetical protein
MRVRTAPIESGLLVRPASWPGRHGDPDANARARPSQLSAAACATPPGRLDGEETACPSHLSGGRADPTGPAATPARESSARGPARTDTTERAREQGLCGGHVAGWPTVARPDGGDHWNRHRPLMEPDVSLTGTKVVAALDRAAKRQGYPPTPGCRKRRISTSRRSGFRGGLTAHLDFHANGLVFGGKVRSPTGRPRRGKEHWRGHFDSSHLRRAQGRRGRCSRFQA